MEEMEEYINQFDAEIALRLRAVQELVSRWAPEAVGHMAYGLLAWKVNGRPLLYCGAWSTHLGLYALPVTHAAFQEKLAAYRKGKGSVQFPHRQLLPLDLIREMILFRLEEVRTGPSGGHRA